MHSESKRALFDPSIDGTVITEFGQDTPLRAGIVRGLQFGVQFQGVGHQTVPFTQTVIRVDFRLLLFLNGLTLVVINRLANVRIQETDNNVPCPRFELVKCVFGDVYHAWVIHFVNDRIMKCLMHAYRVWHVRIVVVFGDDGLWEWAVPWPCHRPEQAVNNDW